MSEQKIRWGWLIVLAVLMLLFGISSGWWGVLAGLFVWTFVFGIWELLTGGPKVKSQTQVTLWQAEWDDRDTIRENPTVPVPAKDEHPVFEARQITKGRYGK